MSTNVLMHSYSLLEKSFMKPDFEDSEDGLSKKLEQEEKRRWKNLGVFSNIDNFPLRT